MEQGFKNSIKITWACCGYSLPTTMLFLLCFMDSYKSKWSLSHLMELLTRVQRDHSSLNFNISHRVTQQDQPDLDEMQSHNYT